MRITDVPIEYSDICRKSVSCALHSVYKRTVNYLVNGSLISMQAKDLPRTPISLCTDIPDQVFHKIKWQDACFRDELFIVGDVYITADDPVFYDSHLIPPEGYAADVKRENILMQLSEYLSDKSHVNNEKSNAIIDMVDKRFEESISRSLMFLRENDTCASADELASLTGLGLGLTPSSDDFLVGVLVYLHIFLNEPSGFLSHLKESVRRYSGQTNDISRALLLAAADGRFSEPVLDLVEALINGDQDLIEKKKTSVEKIGQSSGLYMLRGLRWAAQTFDLR